MKTKKTFTALLLLASFSLPASFNHNTAHAYTNNGIINDTIGVGMDGNALGGNSFTNNGTINVTDYDSTQFPWALFRQPHIQVGMGYNFNGNWIESPPFDSYSFINTRDANINVNFRITQVVNDFIQPNFYGMYALFDYTPDNNTVNTSMLNDGYIHLDYDGNFIAENNPLNNHVVLEGHLYGMRADTGENGKNGYFNLDNNGSIEAQSKVTTNGNFTGSGRFTLKTSFSGLHANSKSYGNHNLNNHGTIKFTHISDIAFTSEGAYIITLPTRNVTSSFYGMYAETGLGTHRVYNHGDIELTSNITMRSPYLNLNALNMMGVYVIDETFTVESGGPMLPSLGGHDVKNLGNIIIKSQVNSINADPTAIEPNYKSNIRSTIYGLFVEGGKIGNYVSNSDLIDIESISSIAQDMEYSYIAPRAIGIYVVGKGDKAYIGGESGHNVSNSGTINVYTELNQGSQSLVDSSGQLQSEALAVGMHMQGIDNANSKMQNSNIINASLKRTAIDVTNYIPNPEFNYSAGMVAMSEKFATEPYINEYGILREADTNFGPTDMELINTGVMNVNSTHKAYGMLVTNEDTYNIHEQSFSRTYVSNTGHINVRSEGLDGSFAYELYANDNTSVGTWATSLNGLDNYRIFGVNDNGSNLHFDQSTLILRPGKKLDGFAMGRVYTFADFVDGKASNVTGSLGAVTTESPMLKATLYGDPNNITTQSFVLNAHITPETNPHSRFMTQSYEHVLNRMDSLGSQNQDSIVQQAHANNSPGQENGMPAGSFVAQEENAWNIFLTPHGGYTKDNDYDDSYTSTGIGGGATYTFNEQFSLGAHFDFNYTKSSIDHFDSDNESTSFAIGLHTNYNIKPEWYVRAQLTAGMGQNENDLHLQIFEGRVSDSNDYDNAFLSLGVHSGYVWMLDGQNSITPELGLSYLGLSSSGYDVNFKGGTFYNGMYDFAHEDTFYGALYGHLSARYDGNFSLADGAMSLRPFFAVGLRQNLSNSTLDSKVYAFENSYTSHAPMDDTVFIAKAGLEFSYNNLTLGLTYDGAYSNRITSHAGMLNIEFKF